MSDASIILVTQQWVDKVVVGLGLCPFAEASATRGGLQIDVSNTRDLQVLCKALIDTLLSMQSNDGEHLDSVLLVHPNALNDFEQYNDFLQICDQILSDLGLTGEFQIASFHPQYRFEDRAEDDVGNYTNRSPFPMLHVLRESSVAQAVGEHPAPESIPAHNIRRLENLGQETIEAILSECREAKPDPLSTKRRP